MCCCRGALCVLCWVAFVLYLEDRALVLPSPSPSLLAPPIFLCSCLALSYIVFPYLILSCLVFSCLVLSCLVMSCLVLSCLVLVLSCLVVVLVFLPIFLLFFLLLFAYFVSFLSLLFFSSLPTPLLPPIRFLKLRSHRHFFIISLFLLIG